MKSTSLKISATCILLFMATFLQPNLASAQQDVKKDKKQSDKQARREQIEAQKIAYITQELSLTPEEAKVFWPVYNEYEAKRHELKKSFKVEFMHISFKELTEKEAVEILDNQIIEAQNFLDLRKEYHSKFKAVLPAVKVLKLYGAERDFQKMLIDKIRQHKETHSSNDKK